MKVEWRLFAGAGVFFALIAAVYWFVSYEHAGSVLLALAFAAVLIVAGWLFLQSRRVGMRPEDREDASIAEGAGALGTFPSSSVWPFVIGWGMVVLANAFVFGVYLGLVGALIIVVGVVGYAVEANRR